MFSIAINSKKLIQLQKNNKFLIIITLFINLKFKVYKNFLIINIIKIVKKDLNNIIKVY